MYVMQAHGMMKLNGWSMSETPTETPSLAPSSTGKGYQWEHGPRHSNLKRELESLLYASVQ